MPDKEPNLKIISYRNLSGAFAEYSNKALEHPDNRSLRELGTIDFSEKSLFVTETIIRIILLDEESLQSIAILKSFGSFNYGIKTDFFNRICRSGSFYTFEVACRNLSLSWQAKKRFLQGEQFGVGTTNGKLFFPLDEKAGGFAIQKYSQIKAQISGIPEDQVKFSIEPKTG